MSTWSVVSVQHLAWESFNLSVVKIKCAM